MHARRPLAQAASRLPGRFFALREVKANHCRKAPQARAYRKTREVPAGAAGRGPAHEPGTYPMRRGKPRFADREIAPGRECSGMSDRFLAHRAEGARATRSRQSSAGPAPWGTGGGVRRARAAGIQTG
jgi:hypothetical protein